MNIETKLQNEIKRQYGNEDLRTVKLDYGFCLKFAEEIAEDILKELGLDIKIVDGFIDPKRVLEIKLKEYATERGLEDEVRDVIRERKMIDLTDGDSWN